MNEALKPRFAVDLDEIERQLAQANTAPAPSYASNRNDPLAELARIVGQDDPFQSLLSAERTRPQRDPAGLDDLFVSRDEPRQAQVHGLRGPIHDQEPPYRANHAAQEQDHGSYDSAGYDQDYYQDAQAGPEPVYAPHDEHGHRAVKSGKRKGMIAVGAVLGSALIGLAGAVTLGGGKAVLSNGEPPLIKAASEPTKIQPQTPGGVEIPNQNKQIYERAASEAQTKVVNREEQPVDVRQATRAQNTGATGAPSASPAANPPAGAGLNLGEPRRVRTVAIRPDGTAAIPDVGRPAAPAIPAPPAMTMPAAAQPAAPPVAASATPTLPAAPRPAATTPATAVAPRATPPAATPSGGASPQATTAPTTSQPAPQRVASAVPTAMPAAPAAQAPSAAPSEGGFSVQLGLRSSESDARAAFQQLQQKYADLGNVPMMIRKAEVNGSTVYRMRAGPLSKDEASSLCSKLQGQGGQCFVAKN